MGNVHIFRFKVANYLSKILTYVPLAITLSLATYTFFLCGKGSKRSSFEWSLEWNNQSVVLYHIHKEVYTIQYTVTIQYTLFSIYAYKIHNSMLFYILGLFFPKECLNFDQRFFSVSIFFAFLCWSWEIEHENYLND